MDLERYRQGFWEVHALNASQGFFTSLPDLLSEGAVLSLEETSMDRGLRLFLEEHAVPPGREIEQSQPMIQATGNIAYAINGTRLECVAQFKLVSSGGSRSSGTAAVSPGRLARVPRTYPLRSIDSAITV